jgi:O-antigen/teichoic acid export membrane protein
LYICCLPTLTALFCLDRLLRNIKNEQVFIRLNVKLLRIISWCCFAVALILLIAAWNYIFLFLLSIMFGLFGLILRVVKNVIEEAVNIKLENDYTI